MAELVQKRELNVVEEKKGLQIGDLVLVAVLIAAGAVLKLVIGLVFQGGVKPNFMIAAYCLAMLLIKPKSVGQGAAYGAVIGLLTGAVCQIPLLCGTPFVNFLSELLGGVVIGAMAGLPIKEGKFDFRPTIGTFIATFISGASFSVIATVIRSMDAMAGLVQFGPIVLVTALLNAIIVGILVIPLRKALNK
jgi:hypothetical protein